MNRYQPVFLRKNQAIIGLAVGCVLALIQDARELDAVELIENGSFEADGFITKPALTAWDDAPPGENNRGFRVGDYPFVSGGEVQGVDAGTFFELPPDLTPDFSGIVHPARAGLYFGFAWGRGNGDGFSGSATQIVDVSDHAGRPYEFSAWLASRFVNPGAPANTDFATVELEFFGGPEATGDSLGSVLFDGNNQQSPLIVGSMNLEGFPDPAIPATQDNWTFYRGSATIPTLAASAAVVIRGANATGVGSDAYVDLVSLQVIPEPTSAVLLLAALFPFAAFVRNRRNNHPDFPHGSSD
jgi:hypothetical protein